MKFGMCVYHATWGHLSAVLRKSLTSVIISTLQSPILYCFVDFVTHEVFYLYQILELQWKESRRLILPRTSCYAYVRPPIIPCYILILNVTTIFLALCEYKGTCSTCLRMCSIQTSANLSALSFWACKMNKSIRKLLRYYIPCHLSFFAYL
jgi:hypothetical protein